MNLAELPSFRPAVSPKGSSAVQAAFLATIADLDRGEAFMPLFLTLMPPLEHGERHDFWLWPSDVARATGVA